MEELEDFQALKEAEERDYYIREAVGTYREECIKVVRESPIGRLPIAQPPGKEIRTCPSRASNGPITRIEARIRLTRS